MKNRVLYPILLFAYIAVVIITSAGAINYGESESIYIVAAILNAVFGAWNAYTIYHNHIKVKK